MKLRPAGGGLIVIEKEGLGGPIIHNTDTHPTEVARLHHQMVGRAATHRRGYMRTQKHAAGCELEGRVVVGVEVRVVV